MHQQSLTSAERSIIELYIDMELVHRNVIADAIEKFNAFTDYQKLKAARRIDTFSPRILLSTRTHRRRPCIASSSRTILRELKRTSSGSGAKGRSLNIGAVSI